MNTMNEINAIIKTVAGLGYKINSIKAYDYQLESEELFKIYRKCSQELIKLAPVASKKFDKGASIALLDHHILNIAREGFDNAFKIYESRKSIKNVNTELPVFINIDALNRLNEGKNECDDRFIGFFKKHNYTPYTFSYKDSTYYVLKDDELDIFEKNFATTGISRNAFEKSLSDLYKKTLQSLIDDYLCFNHSCLVIDKNTEKITTPTNLLDVRIVEILNYMDFEVREGKDPLGYTVFFLWDIQKQKYYLQNIEDLEKVKMELEENNIDCEVHDNYCLVDDLKVINCYCGSNVQSLLELIPDGYFKDYEIDQENMLTLEKSFLPEDKKVKKVYAILKQPLINQCEFDIENAVMLYDDYNEALKVFIDNVQLDLKQYGIYRVLETEDDVNNAWEELIYKFEGYLEYYEVLKALKVN
ncbi:TPA: hypothetical protein SBA32_000068 [Campylobacter jejuni]|uniref:hypothetical protein n=1 Tax=Campylobacter jejuni TaxID=197 RepID=UPI001919C864|nr:hypothetical protein [Campylobacter jejuni]ECP9569184.1 hypothetical protein [Campylobacter jejuni]KAJ9888531.1 hypothetical protein QR473_02000 [Campylobacter jejuni]KAJ9931959.1 hypothetical protein QR466_04610 [Campylobacter jejuni]MCW1526915.1 hypothetical protein [Campylobacter jejuni]HED4868876.1 hypothetical protein [Campylobacter jejuni]